MRTLQTSLGLVVVFLGLVLFLEANGLIVLTLLDIAAVILILSGLLFCVPGVVWRRSIPWLTSLFIPGSLAFGIGIVILYTGQVGARDFWYVSTFVLVALGLAFLGMYYLGPRVRGLWITGLVVGGMGLFMLALLLSVFGSIAAARIVGSVLLVALGLAVVFSSLVLRREHRV